MDTWIKEEWQDLTTLIAKKGEKAVQSMGCAPKQAPKARPLGVSKHDQLVMYLAGDGQEEAGSIEVSRVCCIDRSSV